MKFALAVIGCLVISALIAMRFRPMVVKIYGEIQMFYLFSGLAYRTTGPVGAVQHTSFAIGLFRAYPKFMAIIDRYHE
jgi:hypothetical protein